MTLGVYSVEDGTTQFHVAFDVMGFQSFRFYLIEVLLGTDARNKMEQKEMNQATGDPMFGLLIQSVRKRPRTIPRRADVTKEDEREWMEFANHKDSDGAFTVNDTSRFQKLLERGKGQCLPSLAQHDLDTVYNRLLQAFTAAVNKKDGYVRYSLDPLNPDGTESKEEDDDVEDEGDDDEEEDATA
jgi:hypothetical protein